MGLVRCHMSYVFVHCEPVLWGGGDGGGWLGDGEAGCVGALGEFLF